MPADAGHVVVAALSALDFAPVLSGAPAAGGGGAEVDISAPQIAIVAQAGAAAPGVVQLEADKLSQLDASVLVGGTRTHTSDVILVEVGASSIVVGTGAELGIDRA